MRTGFLETRPLVLIWNIVPATNKRSRVTLHACPSATPYRPTARAGRSASQWCGTVCSAPVDDPRRQRGCIDFWTRWCAARGWQGCEWGKGAHPGAVLVDSRPGQRVIPRGPYVRRAVGCGQQPLREWARACPCGAKCPRPVTAQVSRNSIVNLRASLPASEARC
jgi:hypothetical protein